MGYRTALLNFSKGEISPEIEARFDLDVYKAALRRASNVTIRRTGGVAKRPGTRFIVEALSASSRLIPFQFSDDQAYAHEFAQAIFRPFALGGAVLETGLKVTAITNAANAQVTVAFHGYSVGDTVYFKDQQGMTEINDRFLTVVSVIDDNNFTVDFDSTDAGVWIGPDTGQVNTAPPAAPPPPPTVPPPETPPTSPDVGSSSSGYQSPDISGSGGIWDHIGGSIP
jgi:hypothetical protein